jgi:phosphopantetheinyl transferase (holo-ACP synthase)
MLAFQKTMGAFLSTQKTVIGEYFGSRDPAHAAESWPKFASSNGNGHHAPVTPVTARPWSGDLVEIEAGSRSVARLTLDVQGDPVAEHHTLGGRRISSVHPEWRGLPVLPFAVMAEMLAQGAAWLVPHGVMVALENVQAHRWIRYEPEPVTLEIQARVDPADPRRVAVAIHNRGPVDRPRGLEPPVFEGVAVFADHPLEPPIAEDFALDGPESCRFTAHSIYAEQWLFHGPALQAVAQIGPIARDGIEGRLRVLPLQPLLRSGESAGELFTDPIILDNFTHLLGGWGLDWLADDGDVIFPLRMDRLSQFGERPDEGELVSCRVRILEVERHRVAALAEIVREDGRVWMRVEGWEDWRFHWPGRFRDGFRQPERTFLGEPLELPGAERHARAVWLEPPGDMGRPIWRDVLEHVQLGPDERAAYLALPGPDFRRTHRLWGRIAAKEAARRLWLDQGFGPVYPADLIVTPDDRGRPVLRTRLSDWTVSLPALSIAHVDGVAVALACDDVSAWVGIDVEPVVERSSGFESTAFSALERALLGDRSGFDRAEWIARLWCAKEAAAKATGLGFLDGPSSVEVVRVGTEGRAEVELRGELAAACPGLASCPFIVGTVRRGEFVWAWTLGSRAR